MCDVASCYGGYVAGCYGCVESEYVCESSSCECYVSGCCYGVYSLYGCDEVVYSSGAGCDGLACVVKDYGGSADVYAEYESRL